MTTLAELTVELDVDASGVNSGMTRAEKKFNSSLDRMAKSAKSIQMKPTAIVGAIGAGLAVLPWMASVAAAGMGVAFAGGLLAMGFVSAAKSEEVKKHWSSVKDHVTSEFSKMAAPLEQTLIGFAGNARGIFDSLSPSLTALFADNAPKITEFGNTLETAFSSWGPVIDEASRIFGEFMDGLNSPEFQTALTELRTAITELFGNTDGSAFSDFLITAIDLVTKLLNALMFVQQHATAFQVLGIAIGAVAAALVLAKIAAIAYNAIMLLVRTGTMIWTGVQWLLNAALLANPITWIVLAIIALIVIIVLLIMHWDKVAAAVGIAWDWIKSKIAAAWTWIKGIFATLVTWVSEKWNSLWTTVKTAVATAWQWILDKIDQAKTWIKEKITQIKDNIVLGFTIAKDKAIEIFNKIKDKVKEKIDDVVAFVKSLPTKIKNVFSGAGQWLWDAGKNIINGLLNGLKSMWNTVKGWFSDLTSIIPDWKGPMRVDMKLLEPSGEAIMHGLNVGIDDGWGDTRKNLRGITNAIGESIQTDAERGAGRYSGASATNVTVRIDGLGRGKLAEAIRESVRIDGGGNVQNAFGGR